MKVWLFDIDGTLITSRGAGRAAVYRALADVFGVDPSGNGVDFAGRTDRAILSDLFRRHGIPDTEQSWQRFQPRYLAWLRECLRERSGAVLTGVQELLAWLQRRDDHHVGLLTGNTQRGAEEKLRHFELWHHFPFGGFGDRFWSRADVAHEAVQSAAAHLGGPIAPEDVWIVGDTRNDIRCARAIGARVIAVASGGSSSAELAEERPDLLLEDLSATAALHAVLAAD